MKIRGNLKEQYSDVYSPAVLGALNALTGLDRKRRELMDARIARRSERARTNTRIDFLPPGDVIPGTSIIVAASGVKQRLQATTSRRFRPSHSARPEGDRHHHTVAAGRCMHGKHHRE